MLLEILASRAELLDRCRGKLAARFAPSATPAVVEHGLPLFLDQLASVLQAERQTASRPSMADPSSPIGRSAAMHGLELLRLGYTVDQVVHQYGDVCQAVAEMAIAKRASISADQFRTLNRCLDEAIADAVTAFADERENAALDQSTKLHERLGALAEEQRRLIDVCLQTLAAIQNGQLAAKGATGTALVKTLEELRNLVERTLPEIRLISGVTKSPTEDWREKRPG
jgi:hypothetical protein